MTVLVATGVALLIVTTLGLRLAAAQRTIRDLSRRLTTAELLAVTDPLTGLANRGGLHRALAATLPARDDRQVALLLLDLDRLKFINDRYGHSTGDAVLVEIARRIAWQTAPVISAARLGGDEFVVVLAPSPHIDVSHYAEEYARALRQNIGFPVTVDDLTLRVTASVGIAVLPADDVDQLLRAADQAMYRAKHTGAGICRYYPKLDGPARIPTGSQVRHIPSARTPA
jgi:diguanylate cyclase (GGDEF)-like protein